ncbi:MAG: hypothetical protein ACI8VW_003829, partial [bacterium]
GAIGLENSLLSAKSLFVGLFPMRH